MNRKGSIILYAIILVNLAIFLALLIFTKSEILLKNANYQEYEYVLSRNIGEKADLAIKYDKFMNSNGNGFRQTRCCPTNIDVTGVSTYNGPTNYGYTGGLLYCEANWGGSNSLRLLFQDDYEYFSKGAYNGQLGSMSIGLVSTGIINTASGNLVFSFSLPLMCDLDPNLNSDNYSVFSSGTILYAGSGGVAIDPNQGLGDDDAYARDTSYGYVKNHAGFYNILFNPSKLDQFIQKNKNNLASPALPDQFHSFLSQTSSGYIYLDLDQPAKLRVVEYNSGKYLSTGELKKISDTTYILPTSGYGFLQKKTSGDNSSLSGIVGNYINPESFDFKNKLYAFFLSYDSYPGISDFLTYKLRIIDVINSKYVYHVPLDDSDPFSFKYLGYDIIIGSDGGFYLKELKITRPK